MASRLLMQHIREDAELYEEVRMDKVIDEGDLQSILDSMAHFLRQSGYSVGALSVDNPDICDTIIIGTEGE